MSAPKPSAKISIFGIEDGSGSGDRAAFRRRRAADVELDRGEVEATELRRRMSRFLEDMGEVVRGLPATLGGLELDSVMITTEISAKGRISLLGVGSEIAGKGGITFTLRRPAGATADQPQPPAEDEGDDEGGGDGGANTGDTAGGGA